MDDFFHLNYLPQVFSIPKFERIGNYTKKRRPQSGLLKILVIVPKRSVYLKTLYRCQINTEALEKLVGKGRTFSSELCYLNQIYLTPLLKSGLLMPFKYLKDWCKFANLNECFKDCKTITDQ